MYKKKNHYLWLNQQFHIVQLMKPLQQIDQTNQSLWQKRYSDPPNNYTKAQGLLKKAQDFDYDKGVAYSLLNMAIACFLQSKNREAFELVEQVLDFFNENPEEQGYTWLLHLKASLYESIGDYERGLSLALKAYNHAKERNDSESEAETASLLGLIYSRLCNFEKAIDYYHIAREIREKMGDFAGLASTLNRLGMVCRLTGDYEKAIENYVRSLEIRESNGLQSAIPWTMLGIASTFEEMKHHDKALEYYHKGLVNSDKRCALQCEMGIGRVLCSQGDKDKAEQTLTKALRMAEELQANALIADIYLSLSTLYENLNNPAKAFETYKMYQKAKETVLNDEAKNRLQNIEIAHAIEKSEKEKEIFRLRNVELKAAYDTIEEKNREITSSISYARYIQQAILPHPSEIPWLAENMFILYLPKDIVSGDFYWFTENNGKIIITAADCTGHGVPGAMMSMLGISLLEEIVNKRNIINANEILNTLRSEVIRTLKQGGEDGKSKDGMDVALCVIDRQLPTIQYAGAYNSLNIVRKGELIEYKADKMPIAIHHSMESQFTLHTVGVETGDMIYLFSDGYADQFGGSDGRKFMAKNLKSLFIEIATLPIEKQKEVLNERFLQWKSDHEQVDDVVVLGVKI